jgi:DNA-binding MarR family transcriptional regulator
MQKKANWQHNVMRFLSTTKRILTDSFETFFFCRTSLLLNQNLFTSLARLLDMDVSNVSKILDFFEEVGAVMLKVHIVGGRSVKTPIVDYDKIEFDLRAA